MKTQIIETISDTLYHREDPISETTRLEEIVMDSLDVVELIAVLSSRYHLVIEPGQMQDINTVGEIADYVIANQGNAQNRHPFGLF